MKLALLSSAFEELGTLEDTNVSSYYSIGFNPQIFFVLLLKLNVYTSWKLFYITGYTFCFISLNCELLRKSVKCRQVWVKTERDGGGSRNLFAWGVKT
jgi:hypothetical protein